MGRLEKKVALITGAAGGIGRVAAELFAREGARVVVADVVEGDGKSTVDAIRDAGGVAAFVKADVSDAAEAEAMVRFTLDTFGGLHVLYNNAGILPPDDAGTLETPESTWERVMAVNLKGVWLGCKHGISALLESGGGSIVHMSSVCAITVWEGDCAYDISKAGLNMLSDHIAVEYGTRGIRSNTLMPGVIETELHRTVMDSMEGGAEMESDLLTKHPIGRFGRVEEVADACVFLCAREAGFMTGANISVDGAYSRV
jgi:NAD(P)-dependent dehydrogenase (short-subunit alcohol dehydrogenase family)